MRTWILSTGLCVAAGSAAYAGPTIVSLTYSDLAGSYVANNSSSGIFTARAIDAPGLLRSAGNVSRLEGTQGVADFQPGFVSGADFADFVMTLTVNHGANTGTGSGSFTATDADGDTITGNISGVWGIQGTFITFEGVMSNVLITDNGTQDHTFNGSNTGSWDTNFGTKPPYNGAIVKLTENFGNFFTSNFSNAATGVTAQITTVTVPTPTAALAGLGLLAGMAGHRRARRPS